MFQRSQKGFTLIELLVVIAIIGVLASVILPSVRNVQDKALDSKRVADADALRKALEQHFLEYDAYPDDGVSGGEVTIGTVGVDLVPEFMAAVPTDPVYGTTTNGFMYCATDDLQNYHLRVRLNDDNDVNTTDWCGWQAGDLATTSCPSANTDDLCSSRL